MVGRYKRIMVLVDGSDQSYDALRKAAGVAHRDKAHLFILTDTIMSFEAYDGLEYSSEYLTYTIRKNEDARKMYIVQFSQENNIDLIVMGASGITSLGSTLVSSITTHVVGCAPCKVMVVR